MDIPDVSIDLEIFLESVRSKIYDRLAKELLELGVISFRHSAKLQLRVVDDMLIHMLLSHGQLVVMDVLMSRRYYIMPYLNSNTIL